MQAKVGEQITCPVRFKVGERVMFRNRTQHSMTGSEVIRVNANMFNTLYQLDDGCWWTEGSLRSRQFGDKKN